MFDLFGLIDIKHINFKVFSNQIWTYYFPPPMHLLQDSANEWYTLKQMYLYINSLYVKPQCDSIYEHFT